MGGSDTEEPSLSEAKVEGGTEDIISVVETVDSNVEETWARRIGAEAEAIIAGIVEDTELLTKLDLEEVASVSIDNSRCIQYHCKARTDFLYINRSKIAARDMASKIEHCITART